MGQQRVYRQALGNPHLAGYRVRVKETDLWVQTETPIDALVRELVIRCRGYLESYISDHPGFLSAMRPVPVSGPVPGIIRDMADAAYAAGVGPMAAVAGAVAEYVGMALLEVSAEVMIENGGDIFVKLDNPFTLAIDAGKSPFSYKIGLQLDASSHPLGVCTSSGTIGHSFSYGQADAVCVVSDSCALADAAATAICNQVSAAADIDRAIAAGRRIEDVSAIVVIVGDRIGVWGDTSIVPLTSRK